MSATEQPVRAERRHDPASGARISWIDADGREMDPYVERLVCPYCKSLAWLSMHRCGGMPR